MTKTPLSQTARIGFVLIGRNEGARLERALAALPKDMPAVYVDSGSTDGSVRIAKDAGADVLNLDMSERFTAARARNEGAERLLMQAPTLDYIQFIDGDCALQDGWLTTAQNFLDATSKAAIACGRRRELYPEASIYNQMIDNEWDSPIGEATECGGDMMIRVTAFNAVGGYNADLIAGEEPEMCVRLRASGWSVWRLDAEMTLHDADLSRFSQWWNRTRRAGHAFAQGAFMHGAPPERHKVRETKSAVLWGLCLPLGLILLTALIGPWSLLGFVAYPLQTLRLRQKGFSGADALFLVLGKFPEAQGVAEFHWRRLTGRARGLIEYK